MTATIEYAEATGQRPRMFTYAPNSPTRAKDVTECLLTFEPLETPHAEERPPAKISASLTAIHAPEGSQLMVTMSTTGLAGLHVALAWQDSVCLEPAAHERVTEEGSHLRLPIWRYNGFNPPLSKLALTIMI